MRARSIINAVVVLFVVVSLILLQPGIHEVFPKITAGIRSIPEKIDQILHPDASEEGTNREVRGHVDRQKNEQISTAGVIAKTNEQRAAAGLPGLLYNAALVKSAQLKVDDMIEKQYFEHESPTGVTVSDLGEKVHYAYITMGENLAMGDFTSDADVVSAWMESPGHRENILNNNYKEMGVAAKRGYFNGKSVWFIVQHFGTERSSCPSVDIALKDAIDHSRLEAKNIEAQIIVLKEELEQPDAPVDPDYKQKVDAYNSLVLEYERLTTDTKAKVDTYNAQVRAFNKCLVSYQ